MKGMPPRSELEFGLVKQGIVDYSSLTPQRILPNTDTYGVCWDLNLRNKLRGCNFGFLRLGEVVR